MTDQPANSTESAPEGEGHDAHGHDHPEHLAHHFESVAQQTETGKLGMWAFLATEILMFGGLFCAYAIYRGNHPEVFLYSHKFLDWKLGAINTGVLLTSSLTMAWAVRAAMLGQKQLLVVMLSLTLLGGVGFLVIKYIEYNSKFHSQLYPGPWNAYYDAKEANDSLGLSGDDAVTEDGRKYRIRNIENYYLGKYGVHHDVPEAYQKEAYAYHAHAKGMKHDPVGHDAVQVEDDAPVDAIVSDTTLPPIDKSLHAEIATGPSGLTPQVMDEGNTYAAGQHGGRHVWTYETLPATEQARVHVFYQIYYCMTGLHGLHVLIGMALIIWVLVKSAKGSFSPAYFAPVDLVGLYWHLVDLIWIFLFPLLYLIH